MAKRRTRNSRIRELRRRQRSRRADRPSQGRQLQLETLEPRVLLTTLIGGDVFEYIDADGQTVRIATSGDTVAEIIAADIDDENNPVLGDMPGTFLGSSIARGGTDVLGGRGGLDGVAPIGPTPIDDPIAPAFQIPTDGNDATGAGENNIRAIATRDTISGDGQTWGINVGDVDFLGDDRTLVQLVEFDAPDAFGNAEITGDGLARAWLHQATLGEDVVDDTDDNFAAMQDFAVDPTTGLAYAVNETAAGSVLFSINLDDGTSNEIGPITNTDAGAPVSGVKAIAFDSTGQLFVLMRDFDGDPTADASGLPVDNETPPGTSNLDVALVRVNKGNGEFNNSLAQSVLVNGLETVADYRAMIVQTNPGESDFGTVFAIARFTNDDGEITDVMHRFNPADIGGGGAISAEAIGPPVVGGQEARIEGLAWARNAADELFLAGMDHAVVEDDGTVRARIVELSTSANADDEVIGRALNEPGMVATVNGIGSFTQPGQDRPLLYTVQGSNLIRGSAVALQVDGESGATLVENVEASAFHPTTGGQLDDLMFFIANGDFSDAEGGEDFLYTVDTNLANRSLRQNSLTFVGDTGRDGITTIAFDGAALQGFDVVDNEGFIVEINTNNAATNNDYEVTFREEAVTDITGIAFVPGRDEFVFAVRGAGQDSVLVRIREDEGTIFILGPLPDPDDPQFTGGNGPVTGEDIQELVWNPVLTDPFTGETGVLIASDATSDELIYVDSRPRFPTADIFAVYVSQASEGSTFAISITEPGWDPRNPGVQREMAPWEGSVGQFRVIDAQSGELTLIDAPADTGGVLIGTRTEDINPNDDDEDLIPFLQDNLEEWVGERGLGVRAGGVDDFESDDEVDLATGVNVAENMLEFLSSNPGISQRLLGLNLDNIQGLAVSRAGEIVVVDSDGFDFGGDTVAGDQVAIVDRETGQATELNNIIDQISGDAIGDIQGLDFADLDFDGVETLYAILDSLNLSPGFSIGSLGQDLDWQGVTVSADGQTVYGVAANDAGTAADTTDDFFDLYQVTIDPLTGQVDTVSLLGPIVDSFGNRVRDINAIDTTSAGQIYVAGWNVDAPTPNASVGGLGANITAMAFDTNGDLLALDDVGGGDLRLLRIDLDAPTTSVEVLDASATPDDLNALATDSSGVFYSVATGGGVTELHRSVDAGESLPLDNDLDGLLDFTAMTVTPTGAGFGVVDTGAGFDLYRIEGGTDGVRTGVEGRSRVGAIRSGATSIVDIAAIEADPFTGQLHVIGATSVGGDRALYTLAPDTGSATLVATLDDGGPISGDEFNGLAFDNLGATLYAPRRAGGADTLVTVNTASGVVTPVGLGTVLVNAANTDVQGMDFNADGDLIAIDDTGGGALRVININLDTLAGGPGASTELAVDADVPDTLAGYASDTSGIFYSIFNDGASDNELWVSLDSANHVPFDNTLGGALNFVGFTVGAGNTGYGIVDTGAGFDLYQVEGGADGVRTGIDAFGTPLSLLGTLNDGTSDLIRVSGLASDFAGNLFVIATTAVTGDTSLSDLRNGNGVDMVGGDDFQITGTDGAITFNVNLTSTLTASTLLSEVNEGDGGTITLLGVDIGELSRDNFDFSRSDLG